jgi:hypothetical protein
MEAMALGEIAVNITDENPALGKTHNTYYTIISRETKQYRCAPVFMGNTFQDLLRIIPNAVYNMIFV